MAQSKIPVISSMNQKCRLFIFMGASGSGKSLIGHRVAKALSIPFLEGDEFHPPENRSKMAEGIPLQDRDRMAWLEAIHREARRLFAGNDALVLACSALKERYRQLLQQDLPAKCTWFLLHGPPELIHRRMEERQDHFMPPALLQSQLDALEIPEYAHQLDIRLAPDSLVGNALAIIRIPANPCATANKKADCS